MNNTFQKITDFLYEEKTKELEKYPYGEDMIVGFTKDKTGGALTFLKDRAEPQRGYPAGDYVQMACAVKKTMVFLIDVFRKKGIISKILMVLSIRSWAELLINLMYFTAKDFFLPFKKLSQPVKEIYRHIKFPKIRDLVCFILEFDIAYRFRLQDILVKLNKWAMEKHPLREINRLFNILIERENYGETMKPKWRIVKYISLIYLFSHPKLLKEIQTFLLNINLDELQFSREDKYWTSLFYADYNFRGKDRNQRIEEMKIIYGDNQIKKDQQWAIENKEL